jgi:phosphoglycerate kinase
MHGMRMRSIRQCKNLKGKRVLLRVDFNVPFKDGKVASDYKIKKSLPTIQYLKKQGAKIIIVSHLGRPEGYDAKLSLKPIVGYLEHLLDEKCIFVSVQKLKRGWADAGDRVQKLNDGQIVVLENIRFFSEEEKNSSRFAKDLAGLGDIFVLDGFGVTHRRTASVSGIARFLPAYAGFLLCAEVEALSRVLEKPKHPLVVILGGVKMETKIPVIESFLSKADHILLGGGIVNTYVWALGNKVGNSVVDKKFKNKMRALSRYKKIIFPHDFIIGDNSGKRARVVSYKNLSTEIGNGEAIYDIGPGSLKKYRYYIQGAKTLVWNGAVGYFEQSPYEHGTFAIAKAVAQRSKGRTFGVCGGGETEEILQKLHVAEDIDLVSTGGGAMLEFLSQKKLPGVEAIPTL